MTRILFYALILSPLFFACGNQKEAVHKVDPQKDYEVVCVSFYNVENLFDTLETEDTEDAEFTPDGENEWNTRKYEEKLDKLSEVIGELGTGMTPHGPAILGLSEVENRRVLEDLVQEEAIAERDYRIVHHDSPDERGIDVALLYRPDYFKKEQVQSFEVELPDEDSTRDQLLVSGELRGERTHFMVSHWPSRSGGQAKSEPLRMKAAEKGREVIDSIREAEVDPKLIYMGDLNDDPVDESVQNVLRAKGEREEVGDKDLYNPFRSLFDKGIGTLAWQDNWNLFDQILMTRSLALGELSSFRYHEAKVHQSEKLKQQEGNFKGYPFRTYVGSTYQGGYSDHFPVYLYLIREQK